MVFYGTWYVQNIILFCLVDHLTSADCLPDWKIAIKSLNMRIFKNFFPRFFSINKPKKRIYEERKWKKSSENFYLKNFNFFFEMFIFLWFFRLVNIRLTSNDQPNKTVWCFEHILITYHKDGIKSDTLPWNTL